MEEDLWSCEFEAADLLLLELPVDISMLKALRSPTNYPIVEIASI